MEDTRITSTSSHQYLVVNNEEGLRNNQIRRTNSSESRVITKREWITVIVLCYVNLINYMDRFTIPAILTELSTDFGIKEGSMGFLQTVFIISYMIFAPLFGYLGDRYNRKIIMAGGVFLWCLTTFIGSYMKTYEWFLIFRGFVGIGEASYSTIAPTIISDLFVKDVRSKMLAMFYFAIPVGSGLGYIVGGETAKASGSWQWGLRVTPVLGVIAIITILTLVQDPARGEKEGGGHIAATPWHCDIKELIRNKSFMLSTAGFTCVSFVAGALAWWGPDYIKKGIKLQSNGGLSDDNDVAYKFGLIAMIAGLIGVPFGSILAQKLRVRWQQADPLICAVGLLISAPFVFFALIFAGSDSTVCYILVFFGQLAINLNWSIVADMLLYVVIPTRRSTAEAFQILIAHALGDAGSPYLIGVISEAIKGHLSSNTTDHSKTDDNPSMSQPLVEFRSLQYALFITIFVVVIGSLFFFVTALFIQKDKAMADLTMAEPTDSDSSGIFEEELENPTGSLTV